jgi:GTP-binding protein
VVKAGEYDTFVAADIPGIIKDAHLGKGLGTRFLRHIERTEILLHLVEMTTEEGIDPFEHFEEINRELRSFSEALGEKEQIVAATKMDLSGAEERYLKFKERLDEEGTPVCPISSVTGRGIKELKFIVINKLKALKETGVRTT